MNRTIFFVIGLFQWMAISAQACPQLQGQYQCNHIDELVNIEFTTRLIQGKPVYTVSGMEVIPDGQARSTGKNSSFSATCFDDTLMMQNELLTSSALCHGNVKTTSISYIYYWTKMGNSITERDMLLMKCEDGSEIPYGLATFACAPR